METSSGFGISLGNLHLPVGSSIPRTALSVLHSSRMMMQRVKANVGASQRQAICMGCKSKATKVETSIQQKIVSASLATMLALNTAAPVLANEVDVLIEPTPVNKATIDDTDKLWGSTLKTITDDVREIKTKTGNTIRVVVIRRLEFESDPEVFGDKLLEQWYGDDTDDKGLLLVLPAMEDGAIVGGDKFMAMFDEDLVDSVVNDTIPYWSRQDKPNRAVLNAMERLVAVVDGKEDPGPPAGMKRTVQPKGSAKRSEEQMEKTRRVSQTVVGGLLLIAVVVPMLQYYGYVSKN